MNAELNSPWAVMPFYGVPCRQLRVSDRGTRRDRCDRRASPTAGLPGAAPDAVQFHPSRILLWIDLRVSFRSIDNSARLSHGRRRRSGPSYLWISYAGDGRGGGSAALRSRREHYGAAAGAPRTAYSRQASGFACSPRMDRRHRRRTRTGRWPEGSWTKEAGLEGNLGGAGSGRGLCRRRPLGFGVQTLI